MHHNNSRLDTPNLTPRLPLTEDAERKGMGFSSVQNRRIYYEDRVAACTYTDREALTNEHWTSALFNTVSQIQTEIVNKNMKGGSTLCNVIAEQSRNLHVCSIGDSAAYLLMLNKSGRAIPLLIQNNKIVESQHPPLKHVLQLNKIHKPERTVNEQWNVTEEDRQKYPEACWIKEAGGTVSEPRSCLRLFSALNMSRSVGDIHHVAAFKNASASRFHLPEIEHFEIDWPKNHEERGLEAYVVVVSDGVTDATGFNPQKLSTIVASCVTQSNSLSMIADVIMRTAVKGSSDNISVCVLKLTPSLPITRSILVADGHSSDIISTLISNQFHTILFHRIKQIEEEIIHPPADQFFRRLGELLLIDMKQLSGNPAVSLLEEWHTHLKVNACRKLTRDACINAFKITFHREAIQKQPEALMRALLDRYLPIYNSLQLHHFTSSEHRSVLTHMLELITNSKKFFINLFAAIHRADVDMMTALQHRIKTQAAEIAALREALAQEQQARKCEQQEFQNALLVCRPLIAEQRPTSKSQEEQKKAALKKIQFKLKVFQESSAAASVALSQYKCGNKQ